MVKTGPKGIGKLCMVTINGKAVFVRLRADENGMYKLNAELERKLCNHLGIPTDYCICVG